MRLVTSSGMPEDEDAFSLGLVRQREDTPEPVVEMTVEIEALGSFVITRCLWFLHPALCVSLL